MIAIGGPLIGFATVALPRPEGASYAAPAIAFAASFAAGAGLLRYRERVSWPLIAAVVALGAVVITTVMVSIPGRTAAYAPYFVCLSIFSFYFLRPSWALAEVGWIVALYALAIAADDPVGAFELWVHGVVTTLGVGLLVLALRTRIARLVERLGEAARTDALTGLPNRRAFIEQFEREAQRTLRFSSDFALALIDIDQLRDLNESAGQQTGDAAVLQVAQLTLETVRATDWAAHISGDDFAVILPEVAEPEATRIAERLRESVELASSEAGRPVTVSIGVAGAYRGRIGASELLTAADEALQHAKRLGGNRVTASIETSDYVVSRAPVSGSGQAEPGEQ